MKKNNLLILLSFVVNTVLIADMMTIGYVNTHLRSLKHTLFGAPAACVPTGAQDYSIAIMTPTSHPSLEKIELGFIDQLNQLNKINTSPGRTFKFTQFNGNAKRDLMRTQTEEVVTSGDYDLILTIGATCSQLARDVTQKKSPRQPIIFAAVSNPEQLGLVQSNVRGSLEVRDHQRQLAVLDYLKPKMRRVAIVYDPSGDPQLSKDNDELHSLLQDKGIEVVTVEVFAANEILNKVSSIIDTVDVLITLKDNTIVSSIDALVKLCNRYRVTLLTSDLDSSARGAALAYGVLEKSFGEKAANLAHIYITSGKELETFANVRVDDFKIQFNAAVFESQNLKVDERLLFLTRNSLHYQN